MKPSVQQLLEFYQEEISSHIDEAKAFEGKEQFRRFASLFSPGKFYYWIINFANLQMEYVSEGSEAIIGLPPTEVTAANFLQLLSEEELQAMSRKESMVVDFLKTQLQPEQLTQYKIVYFIQVTTPQGKKRTLLHQATALTVDESGQIEHVLNVHTDCSYLRMPHTHEVSFISLDPSLPSYYNIPSQSGKFSLPTPKPTQPLLKEILTKRETELLHLLSSGHNRKAAAEQLFISTHTAQTHLKNIMAKSESHRLSDLLVRALLEGLH